MYRLALPVPPGRYRLTYAVWPCLYHLVGTSWPHLYFLASHIPPGRYRLTCTAWPRLYRLVSIATCSLPAVRACVPPTGTRQVLTKSLLPLPDKWHGLADVEKRYRQRYLDMIVTPATRDTLRDRSRIVSTLRRYQPVEPVSWLDAAQVPAVPVSWLSAQLCSGTKPTI